MVRRLSQTKLRKKNKKLPVVRKTNSSRRFSKKRSNKGRKQKGGRKTRRRSFKHTISQIGGANLDLNGILAYENYLKQNTKLFYKFVIYDSNGSKYYIFFPTQELYSNPELKIQRNIIFKINRILGNESFISKVNGASVETLNFETFQGRSDDFQEYPILQESIKSLGTEYFILKDESNSFSNNLNRVSQLLSFISENRKDNGNQNYPMTFHFKFYHQYTEEFVRKKPVPWCPDLISFVAKALNTSKLKIQPPEPNDLYGQIVNTGEEPLPFGINEPYVNYKFTFLEKTRCALHITKDTVSEILENQENLYNSPGDAVSRQPPALPPRPPAPSTPLSEQVKGEGE